MTRWTVPVLTGTHDGLDFDAHYTVESMQGVAFFLIGWAQEQKEESWELICEDPKHSREHLAVIDSAGNEEYWQECYLYNEPEMVDNTQMVVAVMVGDDREYIIDRTELIPLPESGYCFECGQTGCHAARYEEE